MGILDRFKRRGSSPEHLEKENPEPRAAADAESALFSLDALPFLVSIIEDETLTPAGLYAHEVLLLDQATSLFVDQEEFPAFWRQQYGVLNMPLSLSSLVSRGFLDRASLEQTLSAATVAHLRKTLKIHGLPVAGRKAELISRLLESVPQDELDARFSARNFVLTAAGIQARDEAPYIPYLHRQPVDGLSIWTLHRLTLANPETAYRAIIFAHLERRSQLSLQQERYVSYRALRYRMYQFFMEENKLKKAFPFLSEVIYYDLSGVLSGFDPLYRYISEKYFFPYDRSIVRLSAGVVRAMGRLKEELQLSDKMLGALLMQFFQPLTVPFHLFTAEECAAIVVLELRGDTERLRQLYSLAEDRFGKRH